jgi:hypothetical protein
MWTIGRSGGLLLLCVLASGSAGADSRIPEGAECAPDVPKEYLGFYARNELGKVVELMTTRLNEAVGQKMPAVEFQTDKGEIRTFQTWSGEPSAYFILPLHLEPEKFERWIADLEQRGWRTPSGRRAIVVLYEKLRHPAVKRVRRKPNVVFVQRPLPGFLAHAILYPMVLLVSPDLEFQGFTNKLDES